MKRLLIVMMAVAMIVVAPATVSAHDEHLDFVLHAELDLVGSDGSADMYEGYHLLLDAHGNVVDEGPATARVYSMAGGQSYIGTIVYDGVEATVVSSMAGSAIGVVETDDGFEVTFNHGETIIESVGFTGRARGTNVVTVGAESVHASLHLNYVIRPAAG